MQVSVHRRRGGLPALPAICRAESDARAGRAERRDGGAGDPAAAAVKLPDVAVLVAISFLGAATTAAATSSSPAADSASYCDPYSDCWADTSTPRPDCDFVTVFAAANNNSASP